MKALQIKLEHTFEVDETEFELVKSLAEDMGLEYLQQNGYSKATSIEKFLELYTTEWRKVIRENFKSEMPFLNINGYSGYMEYIKQEKIEMEEWIEKQKK
tara:strand:- start:2327 stop:2626 length:300 start_codon:yes stop_codon:yes gene_type:complete